MLASWALAACGVPDSGPTANGAPAGGARAAGSARLMRVYFVAPNGSWPVARPAPAGAGPQQALDGLLAGPTRDERARGLVTALPAGTHRVRAGSTAPGTVELYLPWLVSELDRAAVNQLVCTAAAAPGIPGGKRPADVVVRVHESGLPGGPWAVTCDETGAAAPMGAPAPGPANESPE
ncbi:GerMN domain-containing protein [Streptomyces sp. AV19]|nr:GerMN domain-containing protein [Streptomyces sp. AV19]